MNWILSNLEAAVDFFNTWMSKLYEILLIDPITYQNGNIWGMVGKIYDALLGPAVSFMIISFYLGLIKDGGEFIKSRRMGTVAWTFILLCVGASVLQSGKYILLLIFYTGRELFQAVSGSGSMSLSWIEIPKIVDWATQGLDAKRSVLFWIVTLIYALVIMICAFTILMVVYGRLLNIYLHFAIAPIPLSCLCGKQTRPVFESYIRSFIGVCLQGVVIVVVCLIFSAFANGFDYGNTENQLEDISVVNFVKNYDNMTKEERQEWCRNYYETFQDKDSVLETQEKVLWSYLGQMMIMYLLMASMIKGADSWIKQKLNL